jgi:hypothetical protein
VTYDITFVRRRPGRSLLQALEDRAAEYDPDAELQSMSLSTDQRTVWDRIVRRVTSEVGSTTAEEFLYSLTLWREGPSGHLQLDYDGDSADIEIPYRYPGSAALAIVTEAYQIARIIEEETGLDGFDGQTGQPTALGDVLAAAAKLGDVSHWAHENLT